MKFSVGSRYFYKVVIDFSLDNNFLPEVHRDLIKSAKLNVNQPYPDGKYIFRRITAVKEVILYNLHCINLKNTKLNLIELRERKPVDELADSCWLTKTNDDLQIWHFGSTGTLEVHQVEKSK